ncbi:hypothetical protein DPMN_155554 [Dreissena polymorpha]|uniref:Uncharacterized protein n=1 Tax=Dreissena polymorpha TaxID=45954 RepID=A0A9D4JBH1_DREPO|nr:hypothetical protein DPMN_155554 [Dreissena polymorpha]
MHWEDEQKWTEIARFKPHHKVQQISRRSILSRVLGTRSYHSDDCNSDQARSGCRMITCFLRKKHRNKLPGRTRINAARIGDFRRILKDLPEQDARVIISNLTHIESCYGRTSERNDRWAKDGPTGRQTDII